MLYRGLFKRFLPFVLTFAVGMFVASFFVSIAAPNFSLRGRGSHKYRELQRLRIENRELRNHNCRLKKEVEEARRDSLDVRFPVDATPFEMDVPMPPPPPPTYRGYGRGTGSGSSR